jgi:hypothetical protein
MSTRSRIIERFFCFYTEKLKRVYRNQRTSISVKVVPHNRVTDDAQMVVKSQGIGPIFLRILNPNCGQLRSSLPADIFRIADIEFQNYTTRERIFLY